VVFFDSSYLEIEMRYENRDKLYDVKWVIAVMPGKIKAVDKTKAIRQLADRDEKIKTSTLA
jgi:IS5 family transposase